jgi:hypothetical protein
MLVLYNACRRSNIHVRSTMKRLLLLLLLLLLWSHHWAYTTIHLTFTYIPLHVQLE